MRWPIGASVVLKMSIGAALPGIAGGLATAAAWRLCKQSNQLKSWWLK